VEKRGWAYRRRRPEGTVLYEAVRDYLATLLAEAGELERGLPRYVERDFARYLECGVLAYGFARVRCESCKDELLVAFSCKGRLLLLSALACALLTLLGAAGESLSMERYLKANTVKRRTYSLFRRGCMYQAIPNMPEHRLRPLLERFAQLVREQPIFRETFGLL
jgi:hypothetical protein